MVALGLFGLSHLARVWIHFPGRFACLRVVPISLDLGNRLFGRLFAIGRWNVDRSTVDPLIYCLSRFRQRTLIRYCSDR